MRINENDIRKSVVKLLTDAGFNVVAPEVKEGFKKPAVFVDAWPHEFERLCAGMVQETSDVRIEYYPKQETEADCAAALVKMKKLFLKPLEVADRKLTIESWSADITGCVAECEFSLSYMQQAEDEENYEEMKDLNFNLNTEEGLNELTEY